MEFHDPPEIPGSTTCSDRVITYHRDYGRRADALADFGS